MSNVDVSEALRTLLERGVEASRAAEQRTRLNDVLEKNPDDWDGDEWELANQRGLIPPECQSKYELMLLERKQAAERAALLGWQGGNLPDTGTATRGTHSGAIPPVPERPVSVAGVREVQGDDVPPDDGDEPYEQWTQAELRAEIDARNASGSSLAKSGSNSDLATRLYQDDERRESEAQQGQGE